MVELTVKECYKILYGGQVVSNTVIDADADDSENHTTSTAGISPFAATEKAREEWYKSTSVAAEEYTNILRDQAERDFIETLSPESKKEAQKKKYQLYLAKLEVEESKLALEKEMIQNKRKLSEIGENTANDKENNGDSK